MDFFTEINNLSTDIKSLDATDKNLKASIGQCKTFIQSHFPFDHQVFKQLDGVTIEPRGSYFPELYSKLKIEALSDAKRSLLNFIDVTKEEFNRLLIDKPFEDIIKQDESQFVEFKSTLCWDVKNSKLDKKTMGEIIMKSISAFSNSEGGVLLIGVQDDKKILGLADDYKTFKNGSGNKDDFELHLTTLIINNFSKTFAKDSISIEFPKCDKKEICLIRIKKGNIPFTVKISDKTGQQKEKFFVRVNNSSRDIDDLIEFAKYIIMRFPNWK